MNKDCFYSHFKSSLDPYTSSGGSGGINRIERRTIGSGITTHTFMGDGPVQKGLVGVAADFSSIATVGQAATGRNC